MKNPLSTLSKQELWRLFPIILSPHQIIWKEAYHEEESCLIRSLVLRILLGSIITEVQRFRTSSQSRRSISYSRSLKPVIRISYWKP